MKKALITGVNGQIGSELNEALKSLLGGENVVGLDLNSAPAPSENLHEIADVTDSIALGGILDKYEPDTIFHLASLLSVKGEHNPDLSWHVNLTGLKNVLDLAKRRKIRVFWPSSIAVFGPNSPKHMTPQHTILESTTMYGLTKTTGELLCNYYHARFGVDVRSVRYPGIISSKTHPGGGTTDYAVSIFHEAVRTEKYTCFVRPETTLPMMYMADAIKATLGIMEAELSRVKVRTSYNIAAVSFSVSELAAAIAEKIPRFICHYAPDFRQDIADSWPQVIDDSAARNDWGWKHSFDLPAIVTDMLEKLSGT